jgi:hypothetical protein
MPLRVLKNRGFARSAQKEGLTDDALCKAVAEIESGLVDARLGGFLLKKRVAKGGRGKSGGFRTIVAHRQGDRLVCLYMFSKNQRDNISEKERLALSEIGDEYMKLTAAKLDELVAKGVLTEVVCDGDEEDGDEEDERDPR